LMYCLLLNICILFVFCFFNLFLTARYVTLTSLILLTAVPFAIAKILQDWLSNKNNKIFQWRIILLSFSVSILALSSLLSIGGSRTYLIEAGLWLKNNTPKTSRLFANDPRLIFYSERPGLLYPEDFPQNVKVSYTDLAHIRLANYNYVALVVKRTDWE